MSRSFFSGFLSLEEIDESAYGLIGELPEQKTDGNISSSNPPKEKKVIKKKSRKKKAKTKNVEENHEITGAISEGDVYHLF